MSKYKISLIPGDGIGPELSEATLEILNAVQQKFDINLDIIQVEAGDSTFEKTGEALPEKTIEEIRNSHACMKGPVGETAADVIVRLRIMFDLYANIRPIKTYPPVPSLKPDINMIFVRENTEDVYRGIEFEMEDTAICLRVITKKNSERIAKKAFETARRRNSKKRVTAIHKANVMKKTCGLFARTCREVAKHYPDIAFNELYVDAASMRLIKEPETFDVFVTPNMFGDILSDEIAGLVGGLGLAPGGNIGKEVAIFEAVHGSAPDIAGKGIANPTALMLASAMMLEHVNLHDQANRLKTAITNVLQKDKILTVDLGGQASTSEYTAAIIKRLNGD